MTTREKEALVKRTYVPSFTLPTLNEEALVRNFFVNQ